MKSTHIIFCVLTIVALAVLSSSFASKHSIIEKNTPCICPYYKHSFRLLYDYSVDVDGKNYTVPSCFITDLASVPRMMWFCFPPHDSGVFAPSILHDYFYSGETKVSRKFADDVFYNHMLVEGFPRYKAWLFWSGVRIFGWWSFKKGKSYD